MERKAVILVKGSKYFICCDVNLLPEFIEYVLKDESCRKEIKLIFDAVMEGLKSKKYSNEPHGTKAMKPFKNRQNDRILCNVTKRKRGKQCIVMSEIYYHKTSERNSKDLEKKYKTISKFRYEIIE